MRCYTLCPQPASIIDSSPLAPRFDNVHFNTRSFFKERIGIFAHGTLRTKRKKAISEEIRAREDRFDESKHIAMASEIIRERKRLKIRMRLLLHDTMIEENLNISPTKAIECLLRIAYRHHIRPVIARKFVDDRNLKQVSILEFIHHDQLEALLIGMSNRRMVLKRLVAGTQKIGIIEPIAALQLLIHAIDQTREREQISGETSRSIRDGSMSNFSVFATVVLENFRIRFYLTARSFELRK